MPGQLTQPDILEGVPPTIAPRTALAWALGIAAVFAVVGAACGWLWGSRYDAPAGVVYDHTWYADPWDAGERTVFAATGSFVAIAFVAGLLLGLGVSLFRRAPELGALAGVVVGSVLATWLMLEVGLHVAPADPAQAAAAAVDGTALEGGLAAPGKAAWTVFPLASLVALCVVYLMVPARPHIDVSNED